jgi:ubiquitin-like protein Pup
VDFRLAEKGDIHMTTRDTGGQSQSGKSRSDEEIDDVTVEANPEVAERHAKITEDVAKVTEDIDDLLDEFDSVLEENAEEFVRSYVQKGGE